jgi:hypothetical protein
MAQSINSSLLATCPDYDRMTRYLSAWANSLITELENKGMTVYALRGKDANRKKFEGMVVKQKPSIIFINGHGNTDIIVGHESEPLVDPTNASLLIGSCVYAVSCKSAKSLGKLAVQSGATGYIGYEEDFILVTNLDKTRHPLEDKTAGLFLEPSNQIVRTLAKGHNVPSALNKGKKAFSESIKKALNSDVQSDDDKYIPYLLWNMQWLTMCS